MDKFEDFIPESLFKECMGHALNKFIKSGHKITDLPWFRYTSYYTGKDQDGWEDRKTLNKNAKRLSEAFKNREMGNIEKAIENGVVAIDEIVESFRKNLTKNC